MRIAVVTETYPPEVNGVARTVREFVDGLRRRGHTLRVVRPRQRHEAHGSGDPDLLVGGLALPKYPQLRMGWPTPGLLKRAWSAWRPDIVHVATEGPLGWSAVSTARRLGIPVATDFHTNFHAYSGHYGLGWLEPAARAYLRSFHDRADCTLVPTREMAEALAADGHKRLYVVGRGVHSDAFSHRHRSAKLRAAWGAGDDTPVALCVSRFAPEKNFPLVIEAFEAMRRERPDTRLVLVGDGPLLATLQESLDGDAHCIHAGRLVGEPLASHYASADIFLFPSVTETFGNVTLEAMASGLAVVAYDYAAAAQHIVTGRSGVLAPRGDARAFKEQAAALVRDLGHARQLGLNARAVAAKLTWASLVRDLERILIETTGGEFGGREVAHGAW